MHQDAIYWQEKARLYYHYARWGTNVLYWQKQAAKASASARKLMNIP